MDEKEIVDMIVSGHPWEQVIYKIVCDEALDPWDLDISKLSAVFLKYIFKLRVLDFKIPAQYLLIAAILLKMKSEHLHFIDFIGEEGFDTEDIDAEDGLEAEAGEEGISFRAQAIKVPAKRVPRRKMVFEELIASLRKALQTDERRTWRKLRTRSGVEIKREDITKRINEVYRKIDSLLSKLKKDEVKFSSLVEKWEKGAVLDAFMPLMYLDQEKKVDCRQEKFFEEIFIKKASQS
jgi:segregation and condensation protein A